jgi:uncharacterized protein (DUF983 family)
MSDERCQMCSEGRLLDDFKRAQRSHRCHVELELRLWKVSELP